MTHSRTIHSRFSTGQICALTDLAALLSCGSRHQCCAETQRRRNMERSDVKIQGGDDSSPTLRDTDVTTTIEICEPELSADEREAGTTPVSELSSEPLSVPPVELQIAEEEHHTGSI